MRSTVRAAAVIAGLAIAPLGSQALQPVSLVITGGTVVTMDAARRVIAPGAVAVDGSRIVAVGPAAEIAAGYSGRSVIDATGQVVLPGLINTHTHAPMVLYRGLADDLALMDWLQQYIFPAEAKTVSPAFVRTGTRLAVLEMIESGTTTYADMYYFQEEIAAVTKAAGMRGVLGQTIIQFPVADAKTPAEGLARAAAYVARFKDDPLIVPAVSPHALYTNDPATLIAARDLSIKERVPLFIHLAETADEVKVAKERGAASPTAYLESIGFFTGAQTLAAHGVWVSPADIAILKQRGVGRVAQPGKQHEAGQRDGPCRRLPAGRRRPRPRHRWRRQQQRPRHVRGDAPGVVPGQAQHRRSARGRGADGPGDGDDSAGRGRWEWPTASARSKPANWPTSSPCGWTRRGRRRSTTRSRTWSTRPAATTSTPPSSTVRS